MAFSSYPYQWSCSNENPVSFCVGPYCMAFIVEARYLIFNKLQVLIKRNFSFFLTKEHKKFGTLPFTVYAFNSRVTKL